MTAWVNEDTLPLSALLRARELLDKPQTWTIHTNARDDCGRACATPMDQEAYAYCLGGAVLRAVAELRGYHGESQFFLAAGLAVARVHPKLHAALTVAEQAVYAIHKFPPDWNDCVRRTHREVVALLDRAIASERGRLRLDMLKAQLEQLPEGSVGAIAGEPVVAADLVPAE